jgi:LAO/AO transport system kinase
VQAIKAGILEIADIHVVSKCDRADANRTISELKSMLSIGLQLSGMTSWRVPVLGTSAVSGDGVDDLLAAIDGHLRLMKQSGEYEERRRRIAEMRMLKCAEDMLRDRFESDREGKVHEIADLIARLELAPEAGARRLLSEIQKEIAP